jgi:hypothetical protein
MAIVLIGSQSLPTDNRNEGIVSNVHLYPAMFLCIYHIYCIPEHNVIYKIHTYDIYDRTYDEQNLSERPRLCPVSIH